MDFNYRRLGQDEPEAAEILDWRIQLQYDSRQRIVNKTMNMLERHLPISSPEELVELKKHCIRFENKIYTAATSQRDYLQKIALKMVIMGVKFETPGLADSLPLNHQNPPGQDEPDVVELPDWRIQVKSDSRQRIVNKIMDTLKKHLPVMSPEVLVELKKISVKFEDKIYTSATSEKDYLRKIAVKMLTVEAKHQNPGLANALHKDKIKLDLDFV